MIATTVSPRARKRDDLIAHSYCMPPLRFGQPSDWVGQSDLVVTTNEIHGVLSAHASEVLLVIALVSYVAWARSNVHNVICRPVIMSAC